MSESAEKTIEDFFCGCRVGLGFISYVDENRLKLEDNQCMGAGFHPAPLCINPLQIGWMCRFDNAHDGEKASCNPLSTNQHLHSVGKPCDDQSFMLSEYNSISVNPSFASVSAASPA